MYNKPTIQNNVTIPRIKTVVSQSLVIPNQPIIRDLTREENIQERKRIKYISGANVTLKTIPPLTSTFYSWYDASDITSMELSPTNQILLWKDKTPNGNDLTPNIPVLYGTREKNGKKVIDFNNDLYFQNIRYPMPLTSHSIFVVAQVDSIATSSDSLFSYIGKELLGQTTGARPSWQVRSTLMPIPQFSATVVRSVNQYAFEVPFQTTPSNMSGSYYLFEVVFDVDNKTLSTYLNGNLVASAVDNEPFADKGIFAIGANRANNAFINGAVGEIVCLNDISEFKRNQTQQYLLSKWFL